MFLRYLLGLRDLILIKVRLDLSIGNFTDVFSDCIIVILFAS